MTQLIEDQQVLAAWVRKQSGPLDIAVAFWGTGAIKEFDLNKAGREVRILLELGSGGSNPYEVRKIWELNKRRTKYLDRLHAKTFIAPTELIVGSANASANGLGSEGYEATRWHELGLLTTDAVAIKNAKSWFDKLWSAAKPITAEILDAAEVKWKERQKNRPDETGSGAKKDLLSAAIANPNNFTGRGIFVQVSTEDYTAEAEALVEQRSLEQGSPAYAFEDWAAMPVDSKLVGFTDDVDDGIRWDDPKICFTGKDKQKSKLKWVVPTTIPGYSLGPLAPWKACIERAKKDLGKKWKSEQGICMDLGTFAAKYGPQSAE